MELSEGMRVTAVKISHKWDVTIKSSAVYSSPLIKEIQIKKKKEAHLQNQCEYLFAHKMTF